MSSHPRIVVEPRPTSLRRAIASTLSLGSVALAHVVAVLATFTCLVTIPIAAFTLLFVTLIVFALFTNGDLGGPLFYPVGVLMILVVGGSCSLLVCVAGLSTDFVRRALKWPIWTAPLFIALVAFFLPLCVSLARRVEPRTAIADASIVGAMIVAAFLCYWVPLVLSETAIRALRRLAETLHARLRARRAAASAR